MSGIFGAYSVKNQPVLEEVYLGLYALQHRGQESAGIAWAHDGHAASARGFGLLHNAIDQHKLSLENAHCAIGHVRYVPLESSQMHNVLPVCANYARGPIAIAHDGLVTNLDELKSQLEARGAKQFYIKYCSTFDSTPKGNIGPIADAAMEYLGARFTVLCPASFAELRRMVRQALFDIQGPVAVRYPRGGEGDYRDDQSDGPLAELRPGTDVTVLTYGTLVNQALAAADLLARQGVSARVLKLNQIAPLDFDLLASALAGTDILAVAEDAFGAGCVGQRVAAILAEHGAAPKKLILKNLGKTFLPEGTVAQLQHRAGIDGEGIARAVLEARK